MNILENLNIPQIRVVKGCKGITNKEFHIDDVTDKCKWSLEG